MKQVLHTLDTLNYLCCLYHYCDVFEGSLFWTEPAVCQVSLCECLCECLCVCVSPDTVAVLG